MFWRLSLLPAGCWRHPAPKGESRAATPRSSTLKCRVIHGYSVIATTRELSAVLPGFVRYGIGWETSTSNGSRQANRNVTGDDGVKASQLLVARVETERGIGLGDRQTAEKLIKMNVPGVNRIVFTTSSGQTVIAE